MARLDLSTDAVEALARQCFGEPNARLSTARELRFGRRGSVAVVLARGVFTDHEAGAAGGVLQMLVHAGAARTTAEAARLLETGGVIPAREKPADRHERAKREDAALKHRRASAARIWGGAQALAGTIAETYLREARVIAAPLDGAELRFLPDTPVRPYSLDCRERRPALIAKVSDAAGRGIGVHLTFLAPDGLGKADMDAPRKMVGTVGGGCVRLVPGARMVVAEGIESAFSAWDASVALAGVRHEGIGAVAGLSAVGVAAFKWPIVTRALLIAPDRDASGVGERAAQALALRAYSAGLEVVFLRPPQGISDWNAHAMREANRCPLPPQ